MTSSKIEIESHDLPPEVYEVIRLIGRKHAFKVLHTIVHQPLSFNELRNELSISASMLSDLLSDFQLKHIVEKRKISDQPVKHAYFIADPFGHTLCDLVQAITDWGAGMISTTGEVNVTRIES
ncbi:MAG: helix-turn-helix transcriptional regulator [Candidatus Heimdallarchaeota archaeon]|nr:helix-turn-helix transcriptional regulator [Candidatus Heimdallarchaeota archaeon]